MYGISGSGSLAIITFGIIFLDCCNDGDRDDYEEEVIYRVLQIKDTRDNELARRQNRRMTTRGQEKRKLPIAQHQRSQQVPKSPPPPPTCHHHHHHYPQPHHVHHIHSHSPHSHHSPYMCSGCYDSHTLKHHRYNRIDVAVDTSDGFEPISNSKTSIQKSTRDAKHETQTSTMEINDIPDNVTDIVHETKTLKASRSLLPTLKQSMEQQDKDIAISQVVADTNSKTVVDV